MINSTNNKYAVIHVINSFEQGGAEVLLANFAKNFSHPTIELVLAYLKGEGTILRDLNLACKIYDLSNRGAFTIFSIFKLLTIVRRHHVTILHTHDPQSGILSRLAAWLVGVPFVVTTRHTTVLYGRHKMIYHLENYLLRYNDCVVATSDAVHRHLVQSYGVDQNKVMTIHNAIDNAYFDDTPRKLSATDHIAIGTVARLHYQKGVDILLRGFARINHEFPCTRLVIAGDGEERPLLEGLAKQLEIHHAVDFRGSLNTAEVKQLLKTIDIFVLPSRSEGFGIALAEAMASGIPVVGSDVDGIGEIITDRKDGLLFDKESDEDLARKVKELLRDAALRDQLGRQAIQSARSRFSMDVHIQRVVDIYSRFIVLEH